MRDINGVKGLTGLNELQSSTGGGAKTAAILAGRNGIDLLEMRAAVVRIPEVVSVLRQAQSVIDSAHVEGLDLLSFIASDEDSFFANLKIKGLVASLVQVGLFARFLKQRPPPDFLVGSMTSENALRIIAGEQALPELVINILSEAGMIQYSDVEPGPANENLEKQSDISRVDDANQVTELKCGVVVSLFGYNQFRSHTDQALNAYRVVELRGESGAKVYLAKDLAGAPDIKRIVTELHLENGVNRFVSIGPNPVLRASDFSALELEDIETYDSIEIDPMLSWFWRAMKPVVSRLAT